VLYRVVRELLGRYHRVRMPVGTTRSRFWGPVLVAALALVTAASCKRKSTARTCEADTPRCADAKTAIACERGIVTGSFACKGPLGCVESNGDVTCDIHGQPAGDPCNAYFSKGPSCFDAKHAATCDLATKKIVLAECAAKGCYASADGDVCDPWPRVEGGRCTNDGSTWCTEDKKELWACRNGVYHLRDRCTGPRGCSYGYEPGLMGCDVDTGREGDTCEYRDRCDESRKRWLACEQEKLVAVPRCRCAKDGKSKECDP
jgi:hypothetical protein